MFFTVHAKKTYEHHQQEDTAKYSCALSETTQDLLTDPHQRLQSEDPVASGSGASAGTGQTLSPTCIVKTTSAPSDASNESSSEAKLKAHEPCLQSTSAWLDQCKVGSWMKRDGEQCRVSGGPLSASEPRAVITPGEEYLFISANNQ